MPASAMMKCRHRNGMTFLCDDGDVLPSGAIMSVSIVTRLAPPVLYKLVPASVAGTLPTIRVNTRWRTFWPAGQPTWWIMFFRARRRDIQPCVGSCKRGKGRASCMKMPAEIVTASTATSTNKSTRKNATGQIASELSLNALRHTEALTFCVTFQPGFQILPHRSVQYRVLRAPPAINRRTGAFGRSIGHSCCPAILGKASK